jgi:hypothetical protein
MCVCACGGLPRANACVQRRAGGGSSAPSQCTLAAVCGGWQSRKSKQAQQVAAHVNARVCMHIRPARALMRYASTRARTHAVKIPRGCVRARHARA